MKKILLGLALAVFLFAVAGLAGGAGVASAHEAPEGKGEPGFRFDEDGEITDPDLVFIHPPGDVEAVGFFGPNGPGPAHFGHQHNPNCGNMHGNYHTFYTWPPEPLHPSERPHGK